MIYNNNSSVALCAAEEERTGSYGEDGYIEPRVCFLCPECGEAVYEDERYYIFDGDIICDSCIEHHERTAVWEGV